MALLLQGAGLTGTSYQQCKADMAAAIAPLCGRPAPTGRRRARRHAATVHPLQGRCHVRAPSPRRTRCPRRRRRRGGCSRCCRRTVRPRSAGYSTTCRGRGIRQISANTSTWTKDPRLGRLARVECVYGGGSCSGHWKKVEKESGGTGGGTAGAACSNARLDQVSTLLLRGWVCALVAAIWLCFRMVGGVVGREGHGGLRGAEAVLALAPAGGRRLHQVREAAGDSGSWGSLGLLRERPHIRYTRASRSTRRNVSRLGEAI